MKSLQNIIEKLPSVCNTRVDTLDGDTSFKSGVRDDIRNLSNVIFTNPDMLHLTILPRHANWKLFLQNLKTVVVDGGGFLIYR